MNVEAVTIDAYGTLVRLRDPVPRLRAALRSRGVERDEETVRRAFGAEVAFYVDRSHEGRDEATLALLRRDCTEVFLSAAGADLDAGGFADAFVGALAFEPEPGAVDACRTLAAAGLKLAVVSNWDVGLHDHLRDVGLHDLVDAVVTSAEAGAPKPSPASSNARLPLLDVAAGDVIHVGDAEADAEGARAAGIRFEPAPLADAAKRILG